MRGHRGGSAGAQAAPSAADGLPRLARRAYNALMDSFLKQELMERLAEIEASIATGARKRSRQREHVAEPARIGLDAKLSSILKRFDDSRAIRREELGRLANQFKFATRIDSKGDGKRVVGKTRSRTRFFSKWISLPSRLERSN
jgi:hypothetical protein